MDDDQQIRLALHRAVGGLDAPTDRLIRGGVVRGRRRQRLVRRAEAVSVLAVLAGTGALVIALVSGGAPAPGRQPVGAAGESPVAPTSAAGAATSTPPSSASPPSSTDPPMVISTAQVLLQTAIDTLPRRGTTTAYAGNFFDGWVGTQFVYDDGDGAAQIYAAMVYRPDADADATPCNPQSSDCTVLADGAHAQTYTGREYSDDRTPNATERHVVLVRTDGVAIELTEFNAPEEKGAALTRAEPPFSLAALTSWADDPAWQLHVSPDRAAAAAHLFTPDDLNQPAPGATDTGTQSSAGVRAQQRRNCALARHIKKSAPAYCH